MKNSNIFVGRQPIFDRHGDIYGYELLYRNSDENRFPNVDPKHATLNVLMNTFLSIGANNVAGKHKLFINFSEQLLKEELFLAFNPEVIIIEVLETVLITPEVLQHIRKFKEAGYKIALDDFKMREDYFHHKDIFELVDIIKVDLLHTSSTEQIEIFALRQAYPKIKLLAEKVETKTQREIAEKLSYDLFQGYFYAIPDILTGFDIAINPKIYDQIMEELAQEKVDLRKVAICMMRDISLVYKLIRYVNSMSSHREYPIKSIQATVEELGEVELRKWMQVVKLHEIDDWENRGANKALMELSLFRAQMCWLLAKEMNLNNADEYFLLGMFSVMEVVMKQDIRDITNHLHFSSLLEETLHGQQTKMSTVLEVVICVEKLRVEEAEQLAEQLSITKKQLSECSQASYRWLHQINDCS